MKKTKLIAGIVLIFLLGGVTGGLTVQTFFKRGFRDGPPKHRSVGDRAEFIVKRLAKDLDLSPAQVDEIRPIVQESEKAVSALMDSIDPELRATHDRGLAAIREKLNPEQQEKLDQIKEKMKKFRERRKKTK